MLHELPRRADYISISLDLEALEIEIVAVSRNPWSIPFCEEKPRILTAGP